jgi:hypothetical protein
MDIYLAVPEPGAWHKPSGQLTCSHGLRAGKICTNYNFYHIRRKLRIKNATGAPVRKGKDREIESLSLFDERRECIRNNLDNYNIYKITIP